MQHRAHKIAILISIQHNVQGVLPVLYSSVCVHVLFLLRTFDIVLQVVISDCVCFFAVTWMVLNLNFIYKNWEISLILLQINF